MHRLRNRGLSVDDSADEELNKLFDSTTGGKVGVVFYGSEGYLVQRTYTDCIAYDKEFKEIKQFKGGGDHYANFVDACVSRNAKALNAAAREGHLSAAISHLGNISYYLGEANKVSADEAERVLAEVKSLDDNAATLERTLRHLTDNGVELSKYPISAWSAAEVRSREGSLPGQCRRHRADSPRISRGVCLPHRRTDSARRTARVSCFLRRV